MSEERTPPTAEEQERIAQVEKARLSDEQVTRLKKLASPAEQAEEQANAERREYMKQAQRASRERKAIKSVAEEAETREQWWTEMRKSLPKELREKYAALEEETETQLSWMADGWKFGPNDPDYVSFEDGLKDLDAFIQERGLIHDSVTYGSLFLQDIRPIWAVWADERSRYDPTSPKKYRVPFWRCKDRLNALTKEEGEPTKVFALYGIYIALPDYHVNIWKQRTRQHPHHYDIADTDKCWLCKFEKAHKK